MKFSNKVIDISALKTPSFEPKPTVFEALVNNVNIFGIVCFTFTFSFAQNFLVLLPKTYK